MIKYAKNIRPRIALFLFIFLLSFLNVALGKVNIKPLFGVKILLDPGHGGYDPGAIGPSGLKESHVNLRVARYLKYLLEADGATVCLTREKDNTLALSDRIRFAETYNPHLFVSIHHNSSLSPRNSSRAEIYYAAADHGISKMLADSMRIELAKASFGDDSVVVPGGFYLLRNSPCPAIISEAAYISVADSEKQLMTGKALTNQAQALRTAIKKVLPTRMLNVDAYLSDPLVLSSPYFNFILTSDKPIESINGYLKKFPGAFFFGFERMLGWCNSYKLYNVTPLHSGDFVLNLMFRAKDNSVSPQKKIRFNVKLPVSNVMALPIAPYIPKGFKGKFPVFITLSDALGRPNTRKAKVKITSYVPALHKINKLAAMLVELASLNLSGFAFYEQVAETFTSDKGDAILHIDLSGDENGFILIYAESEGTVSDPIQIPIQEVESHYVLGRLLNKSESVSNAKILFDDKSTVSARNGYFFFETPHKNLTLDIVPTLGFSPLKYNIASMSEPVNMPLIEIEKVSENLYGKTIGIISPNGFDLQVRKLTSLLLRAGCNVIRFKSDEKLRNPEYQNVLDANLQENLLCLLSFKNSDSNIMKIRHYHRKGTGSRIATKLCEAIGLNDKNIEVAVMPGSDYEINHSQATALVLALPQKIEDSDSSYIIEKLFQVLNVELK